MSSRNRDAANRLEDALTTGGSDDPTVDRLVGVAALLRPNSGSSETRRAEIKAAMMQAARTSRADDDADGCGDVDAGTQDADDLGVHTAEVLLSDGRAVLADVERIDAERAVEVAERVATVAGTQRDPRDR